MVLLTLKNTHYIFNIHLSACSVNLWLDKNQSAKSKKLNKQKTHALSTHTAHVQQETNTVVPVLQPAVISCSASGRSGGELQDLHYYGVLLQYSVFYFYSYYSIYLYRISLKKYYKQYFYIFYCTFVTFFGTNSKAGSILAMMKCN